MMRYKVGDRVWWDGFKGVVTGFSFSDWGSVIYETDIVFEPDEDNPTVKTTESSLKPIIRMYAYA